MAVVVVLVLLGSGWSCCVPGLCHRDQELSCSSVTAHCRLPQLKGTAASPPAQGASSFSGYPAAMSKNSFWGLSKLLQCPCGKSVIPSSSAADFQPGLSSTALLTAVGMVLSTHFCILCSLPGCARLQYRVPHLEGEHII